MTFEVLIRGGELSLQEPVARVLCPVEGHDGPCEVPWGFSVSGQDDLVLGIYASPAKAAEVVERVQEVVGASEVVLSPAPADHFEELAEQHRIEHGG
ncbi:hypothetical protein AB0H36_25505 [Kribbella sp. NPDC050820]|uniref:hypothetical protein n=1 Tax=Kribbella sp. NPDC050820 TaxID=3155408 RepID=UPI0033F55902